MRASTAGLLAGVVGMFVCVTADAQSSVDVDALRRGIVDLSASHPETYGGAEYLARLDASMGQGSNGSDELAALQREAMLANPLLDFDEILVVRRSVASPNLGLPANWQGNCSLPRADYDNEIDVLSGLRSRGSLRSLYRPDDGRFVGDTDLEFDGDRIAFSMPGSHDRFQIWEIRRDGSGLRQVTRGDDSDVDNYDPCYLPDGRIIFGTTAYYQGVPCVYGSDAVANLCIMDADGGSVRQLCFEQDHDWCPAVLNGGRVLYTRWEYADLPHSNTRLLFHMNPDGTEQMEYYGSNSYWPTSVMYARPVPGHPTKVAAIVTGHHGVRRMGELVILDPARGRHEASGAVQRIPGAWKAVEPIIKDNLADDSWPKFLHPWPLSEKYFLVACQPRAGALWGIYLVDVFDNMVLIREEPGYALLEPIPFRSRPRPPRIPDKVKLGRKDAIVYLADVYSGEGLAGVPRGTVKRLRLFTYSYAYRGMGGLMGIIGMDGPWDVKRILGTAPVEEDGSALFRVPANTPISVQPLDAEGKALQLMRSWFTAMPGENVTCIGCHDRQNRTPRSSATAALRRAPSQIVPWRGPVRGFSFDREVQPVLKNHCIRCHGGETDPDLRSDRITDWKSAYPGSGSPPVAGHFSKAYAELQRFVRRPGIESDDHLLTPLEFHADTTELVQMLQGGHYGVQLGEEDWDRLTTWIDLNTPFHGTWTEIAGADEVKPRADRRRELFRKYAGGDDDPEAVFPETYAGTPSHSAPSATSHGAVSAPVPGWPFPPAKARRKQEQAGTWTREVDLGEGVTLTLVYIPPGQFRLGDNAGAEGERPAHPVSIEKGFWMGRCEVTNRQFTRFAPRHDSRVESMHAYQFGIHGYPLNEPEQPAVRVSWNEAVAFCDWVSERTGERFTLPNEAQWEYACRAGSATAFSYGGLDTGFSAHANLGDAKLTEFARNTYIQVSLLPNPNRYDDWIPKDARFNDGGLVTMPVGSYQPNAWGLCDMHGNAWEWTLSAFKAYPYTGEDGRNDATMPGKRVVRGGSWYDRPKRCTSAFRLAFPPWQRVFNVGFRVVAD